jgi:2-polyprenyl-6-methoxyphenol hydroxylase-like FAD-dependent oxidoreductase
MKRVLIVGGGIGGLTLAIGLHRVGAQIELIEQAPAFEQVGAGITIQANANAVLQALGVQLAAEDILSIGKFQMLNKKHVPIVTGDTDDLDIPFRSVNIHRADLHTNLLRAADGISLRAGLAFRDLTVHEDSVEVTLSNGGTEQYDIVVGADGIHSSVRKALLGEEGCATRYSGQTCWRFACAAPGKTPNITTERWRNGQRIGAVPLSRGRIYIYMVQSAEPGTSSPQSSDLKQLQSRFGNWHEDVDKILFSIDESVQINHRDLHEHEQIHFGKGRVILIGDAAHAMTPNLGQGAGMAIEDAGVFTLLWKQGADNIPALLAQERTKRIRSIMKTSWQIGQMTHWENPLACGLRDFFLKSIPKSMSQKQTLEVIWKPGMDLAEKIRAALG